MLTSRRYFFLLLASILLLSLWRFSVLSQLDVSLYVDEAQYWYWAKHLDFGYYSKPPVVALLIAFTTSLFGDGEIAVRIASILIYPLTGVVVFAIGNKLYSAKAGFISAIVFLFMPGVSVSSLVISTDVPFFLCWAIALYAFIQALESDHLHWWVIVGVAGGVGLQSKYTMGVFAISVIIYLCTRQHWKQFVNPRLWLTAVIAGLIWLPNLWWNYNNNFITFQHTYEISEGSKSLLHWSELLEFLGGQLGVFGIVAFPLLVYLTFKHRDRQSRLLLVFTWTFIVIISLQALQGRANANWAAPAYLAGSIVLGGWLATRPRQYWFYLVIGLNLLTAVVLYYPQMVLNLANLDLTAKTDIYKRLRGWPVLANEFSKIQEEYPKALLMGGGDRTIIAHLAYQSRPHMVTTWNPENRIRHHYDLNNRLPSLTADTFLYVTKNTPTSDMKKSFDHIDMVGELSAYIYPDYSLNYKVYHFTGFKGYLQ